MAEFITISINELRALLRKAFEGLYGHNHDWNALTDQLLWLEFHGLNGVNTFLIEESSLSKVKPRLIQDDLKTIIVDGEGSSLLVNNILLCDLLLSKSSLAIMHVRNVRNPEWITASVARCTRYEKAAAACWSITENKACLTYIDKDQSAPELLTINKPSSFLDYNYLTMITAETLIEIKQNFPEWFENVDEGVFGNEIEHRYEYYLEHGFNIQVNDYNHLCACADRVLVEASEASRQGAGE